MEDSDYRDMRREELMQARRAHRSRSGGSMASVAITLLLLIITAVIFLHHMGYLDLPKNLLHS